MSDLTMKQDAASQPLLQLHLEPDEPLEVKELTATLGSLARQYQVFVERDRTLGKGADARLLVSSVSPGSIDIAFLPDLKSAAGLLATAYDPIKHVLEFAKQVKELLGIFGAGKSKDKSLAEAGITAKDCDDAINIVAPTANHGGTQHFYAFNGEVFMPIINVGVDEARQIVGDAQRAKSLLQAGDLELRQRVPMVWKRLDRSRASVEGQGSPDRALIEEIDRKDRPAFFTDEMTFLKENMIGDDDNPYQHVYFVDVEVSRLEGKVMSYRIVGFHGKEDLS